MLFIATPYVTLYSVTSGQDQLKNLINIMLVIGDGTWWGTMGLNEYCITDRGWDTAGHGGTRRDTNINFMQEAYLGKVR